MNTLSEINAKPSMPKLTIAQLGDGSSPHLQRIAAKLAARGHAVHVISGSRYLPYPSIAGVTFHVFNSEAALPRKIAELRSILGRLRPDVLHSHFVNHGGIAGVLTGYHPHLISAWGDDVLILPKQSLKQRVLVTTALRAADWVLPLSEHMRREVVALCGRAWRNEVFYWGADLRHFSPDPARGELFRSEKLRLGRNHQVVYSPRNCEPLYNHHLLLEAWPQIQAACPSARLVIKRTGTDRKYEALLAERAEQLGVAGSVLWLDHLSYDDLAASYNAADIVVSLPPSDGTPITVLEAMACGRPIVAGDIAPVQDWVIPGQTGVRVPLEAAALGLAISGLLTGPATDLDGLGQKARDLVVEKADMEKCFDRLETLYQAAKNERGFSWLRNARNFGKRGL